MFQKRTLGLIVSILMLTTACGQKGDLYLPTENPPVDEIQQQQQDLEKEQHKETTTDEKQLSEPDGHMP